MGFFDAAVCILFTTLAASYAWGMRGAVIGGEKGAMLPGAFIGLILAWFSGGGIRECFWIPAAAGLMGMTFGGIEPYGETIGMVLHRGRSDYRPVKGYFGLAFKGALWFSVCGGFIAFALSAMSGAVYSAADIIIFCLLITVIEQIGYRIFNRPYDKEKGIYPKIYYSLTRREEWGSNLTLLVSMLAMAVIRGDDLALAMIAGGFFFGGVGWLVAMKFYVLSVFPLKNGKYLFGRLHGKGMIDGWKNMEFALGAAGGFGLSLAFCMNYGVVEKYNSFIAQNGRFNAAEPVEGAMPAVMAAVAALLLAVNAFPLIRSKRGKKVDGFVCDLIERPLFNVIPMLFVLLGSQVAARLMTAFMLIFACALKCAFDMFDKSKLSLLWQAIFIAGSAAVFAADIILGGFGAFWIAFSGTVPYLAAELLHTLYEGKLKGVSVKNTLIKSPFALVYSCFVAQSILICFASWKIFGV